MSIELSHISKSFGTYQALRDVSLSINDGELVALLGPERLRQDHAPADHRRLGHARRRPRHADSLRGRGRRQPPGGPAPRRLRVSALRAVSPHERFRERGVRHASAAAKARPSREASTAASTNCWGWCNWTASASDFRRSFRAASGNGRRSRGRWPSSRRCCCWTNRSARWMPRCGKACGPGCEAARRNPRHQHSRDARPGRSARSRRPRGRDEQGPHRTNRHAGRGVPSSRPRNL